MGYVLRAKLGFTKITALLTNSSYEPISGNPGLSKDLYLRNQSSEPSHNRLNRLLLFNEVISRSVQFVFSLFTPSRKMIGATTVQAQCRRHSFAGARPLASPPQPPSQKALCACSCSQITWLAHPHLLKNQTNLQEQRGSRKVLREGQKSTSWTTI